MRSRIFCLALFVTIIFTIAGCAETGYQFVESTPPWETPAQSAAASDTPLPKTAEEETLLAAYRAYHDVLKTAIDEYGYGSIGERGDNPHGLPPKYYRGLIYAELVDFDNGGLPELLFIYGDDTMDFGPELKVYGYSGGLVPYDSFQAGIMHVSIDMVTSRSGLSYMLYNEVYSFDGSDRYYSIVNGEWTVALDLAWKEHWDTGELEWFINGNPASEQSYQNAPELEELGITNTRVLWKWGGGIEKMNTERNVLADLESAIAALERLSNE